MCLVAKPALWILQRQNPILGCLNYRQCLSMFAVFDSQSRILEVGQTATSNPIVSQVLDLRKKNTGWWYTYPFEKYEFVSWGYYSQYMEKMFQTTNQEKKNTTHFLCFNQHFQSPRSPSHWPPSNLAETRRPPCFAPGSAWWPCPGARTWSSSGNGNVQIHL